jgi:general secretion pathway protein K
VPRSLRKRLQTTGYAELSLREPRTAGERTGVSQKGFVLITLLVVISLLFPIVIAFYSKTQINLLQASNFRDTIQAVRMARSGVEAVSAVLRADNDTYDGMTDKWALAFPALIIGDEKIDITVTDEDSKLNINMLVGTEGQVNEEFAARLRGLIRRIGGKEDVVNALIDWIDPDDVIGEPGGAEDEHYKELGYGPKNGPVDSLDELRMIKGFDEDLLVGRGLLKLLTVAPTDGKLNINTAPAELLRELGSTEGTTDKSGKSIKAQEGLRDGLVEEIVKYREREPFTAVADMANAIGVTQAQAKMIEPLVKVNSSFFSVTIKGKVGKVRKDVTAVLKRENKAITVISWRES